MSAAFCGELLIDMASHIVGWYRWALLHIKQQEVMKNYIPFHLSAVTRDERNLVNLGFTPGCCRTKVISGEQRGTAKAAN